MKKVLLSLAVAGFALSAQAAQAQVFGPSPATTTANKRTLNVVVRTSCGTGNTKINFIPIAEAYPAASTNFVRTGPDVVCAQPANLPAGCFIAPNRVFCGASNANGRDNTTAAPGALCLQTRQTGGMTAIPVRLAANCFAAPAPGLTGFGNCVVQSVRLQKFIPNSNKCPFTYNSRCSFTQFGPDIRTWWTLIYSAPGTRFVLDVTTVCSNPETGRTEIHIDRYIWQVVVSLDSLAAVIDVLHSNTLGTSEIPCIVGEDVYQLLVMQVDAICKEVAQGDRFGAQNELFNTEALILTFCAMETCFFPEDFFGTDDNGCPIIPGNDTRRIDTATFAGIIDTLENPCCCKLLVDLEKLGEAYGIVGA